MRYNPILDKAPAEYAGVLLNTDFKQVFKFFRLMAAEELDENEKSEITIRLFVSGIEEGTSPDSIGAAIEAHITGPTKNSEGSTKKTFDFIQDSGPLLAAFRQVYNINLKTESMHWWDFMELFGSLPKGTHLMEIIEIRNKKVPKKGDIDYIRSLRRLKRLYALDSVDNSKQVQADISKLMNMVV